MMKNYVLQKKKKSIILQKSGHPRHLRCRRPWGCLLKWNRDFFLKLKLKYVNICQRIFSKLIVSWLDDKETIRSQCHQSIISYKQ